MKIVLLGLIYSTLNEVSYSRNTLNMETKAKKENVKLIEMAGSHRDKYIKINQYPEVRENHWGILETNRNTKEEWAYYYNKQSSTNPEYRIYMIYFHEEIVGYIYFFPDRSNREIVYVAYSIEPKYWNKGIGTIALEKMLFTHKQAIKNNGVKKIHGTVKVINRGSIRVLEKNGFIIIGELMCNHFPAKLLELKL